MLDKYLTMVFKICKGVSAIFISICFIVFIVALLGIVLTGSKEFKIPQFKTLLEANENGGVPTGNTHSAIKEKIQLKKEGMLKLVEI